MQCHRIEELLELLQPAWIKRAGFSLVQFVAKLAEEVDLTVRLSALTDDMLIPPPQDAGTDKQAMIPGWPRSRALTSRKPCSRPAASSNPGVTSPSEKGFKRICEKAHSQLVAGLFCCLKLRRDRTRIHEYQSD